MAARNRLNEAYLFVVVIWATFLGLIYNSWTVFGVAAAILIILNLVGGNIRFSGHRFGARHRGTGHRLAGNRR